MSRKNGKNLQDKITELEALYGQKETARRLGISPSTLRNYKTGKSKPPKKNINKISRVYGQNKKHIKPEQVERYKKQVETKQKARNEKLRRKPKIIATNKWVKQNFNEQYVIQNMNEKGTEYIAVPPGERTGQLLTPDDIANDRYGLPKGTKYVTVYGLYTDNYNQSDEDKNDLLVHKFPILLRKEMLLDEALDYIEGKFFETSINHGRRKLNPTRFIGYKL